MKKHTKNHHIIKHIKEFLYQSDLESASHLLKTLHVPEIVDIFNLINQNERITLLRALPKSHSARVFRRLDTKHKNDLLNDLSKDETNALLKSLRPDERVNLVEKMPKQKSKYLLGMLEPEDLAETKKFLSYPKNSVGRLATPDFVAVQEEWTIEEVLTHVRKRAKVSETIDVIFVVGGNWKLLGQIELSKIVLAAATDKVSSIYDKNVAYLVATDDQENAVKLMNKHKATVAPVVDGKNSLIGIVTFDDVIEIAQLETTEDIHKSSAIIPMDVSYINAGVWKLFRKRIAWLFALVLVSLASSGVIAAFEDTLSSAIALAFFIPLLIGSGGNVGAQSATLMIRAVSLGEVKPRDWLSATGKEMAVGISLAIALGAVSSFMGLFMGGPEIGIIVGLSMAAIIVVTNILGALLPFILTKFKIDPAVASGPLVTSVADIIGLSIYFSIAGIVFGNIS